MRWTGPILVILVLLLGVGSGSALASARLGAKITTKSSVLDESDKSKINQFVMHWTEQLTQQDDTQVKRAGQMLVDPISAAASKIFLIEYRRVLGQQLNRLFNVEEHRDLVRLNTVIVATQLREVATVPLLVAATEDANPGIRYWSGKAMANLASIGLSDILQHKLLEAIDTASKKETVELVLGQWVKALVKLTIPQAMPQILQALNKQVSLNYAQPQRSLKLALDGFNGLRKRLVSKVSRGQKVDEKIIRQFVIVACRYELLAATLFDQQQVPQASKQAYMQILKTSDDSLDYLTRQVLKMDPAVGIPSLNGLSVLIRRRQWDAIKLRALDWRALIVNQMKVPRAQLTL